MLRALVKLVRRAAAAVLGGSHNPLSPEASCERGGVSHVERDGKWVQADEGFHAWMSGDLSRMERALAGKTRLLDRHFLFLLVCQQTYKQRAQAPMRAKFLGYAREHVATFGTLAPVLKQDFNGRLPRVPTFQYLATVLTEDEAFDEAIQVCRTAIEFGLADGTQGGFEGRVKRIQIKREKAYRQSVR